MDLLLISFAHLPKNTKLSNLFHFNPNLSKSKRLFEKKEKFSWKFLRINSGISFEIRARMRTCQNGERAVCPGPSPIPPLHVI